MIKLLIVGPNGNMGRALVRAAAENPRIDVVAGVGPEGRDYIGMDLGLLVGLGKRVGARVFDDIRLVIDGCDVVLDCTSPAVSMDVLEACLEHGKAFVTGTTAFSGEQARRLRDAGDVIPVLVASNASPIVHLLYDLIRLVTREVGEKPTLTLSRCITAENLMLRVGRQGRLGRSSPMNLDLISTRSQNTGERDWVGEAPVRSNSVRSGPAASPQPIR
jgi:4-hydroxy-tetrahydrodipicolinate reductase